MSEFESVDGFLAPAPEDLVPFFPAYEIHHLIATGGMGAVYHALQISLDREVAIKILPAEFSNDESFCQSFEAEAKAMAKLNHPNLIGVFDFGEANGMLFIVMEYVPGLSLHDASCGAALDPAEVTRLIKKISAGLAHAHDHGILHRDIKPANILLDQYAQPKIGDFGLARPVDLKIKEGEVIYGTPGYTAPEVLVPPHHADQRADIFSLGVMLHELLTGKLPEADPRPPSAICHCDPRLDAVVRKATQQKPELRYQSAAQIAEELEKIENSSAPRVLQTGAASPGRRSPARPGAPARPGVPVRSLTSANSGNSGFLIFMLLLLALAIGAYFMRDQWMPSTKQEDPMIRTQDPTRLSHMPQPTPTPPEVGNSGKSSNVPPKKGTGKPRRPSPYVPKDPEPKESDPVVSHNDPEEPEKPEEPIVSNEPTVTTPLAPQVAKFNVPEFLKNARQVMIRKSAFDISRREGALKANMAEFKRDGKRLIRKVFPKTYVDVAEKDFEMYVDGLIREGNRIGSGLNEDFESKTGFPEFFEQFQEKEAKIDAGLVSALSDETQTYLQGLEIRAKKLREENDPVAADEIQSEIDSVKGDSAYFVDIMVSGNK